MKSKFCFLSLFPAIMFLLPYPTLGQTPITVDTTLTADHVGGISIDANDITLDCDGFSVLGTGAGVGIRLFTRTGVIVRRCHVEGFFNGFDINFGSSNNTLEDNTAHGNTFRGFVIANGSNYNTFAENTAGGNAEDGFRVIASFGNIFEDNIAEGNTGTGFTLTSNRAGVGSSDNTLDDNTAQGNSRHGFFISATSSNNTLEDNTAQDNTRNGFVILGSNNTLEDNTAQDNTQNGFVAGSVSSNNTFEENEGCGNGDNVTFFDAFDAIFGNNVWVDNDFCTSSGI